MLIREELNPNEPLTQNELDMLKNAKKMPIIFDEDCPELTDEQLSKMYRAADRNNQSVTVHLSPKAIEKTKSLGTNSAAVLSQLLEKLLNNDNLLKQCL